MALSIGIVGLPNVGKSTLFNALGGGGAEAANYPFCTIDPNVGIVPVPDARIDALSDIVKPQAVQHDSSDRRKKQPGSITYSRQQPHPTYS